MQPTHGYRELISLVDNLISVFDQVDATALLGDSPQVAEARRERLSCELRNTLSQLRQTSASLSESLWPRASREALKETPDSDLEEGLEEEWDTVMSAALVLVDERDDAGEYIHYGRESILSSFRELEKRWDTSSPEERPTLIDEVLHIINSLCDKRWVFRKEDDGYRWARLAGAV